MVGVMMARKTLGRPATGLPRYYLDVRWWGGRRFVGLDGLSLFVWQAGVSYCTEKGTDGFMPGNLEDLSLALGVRLSELKRSVPKLLACGVWSRVDDSIVSVGWTDHNPSKAEIDDYTAERSKLGKRGNHVRHHYNKGIVEPSCELCVPAEFPSSDPDRDPITSPDSTEGVPCDSVGMGWVGLGPKELSGEANMKGDVPLTSEQLAANAASLRSKTGEP
jgi:hypothetical protein